MPMKLIFYYHFKVTFAKLKKKSEISEILKFINKKKKKINIKISIRCVLISRKIYLKNKIFKKYIINHNKVLKTCNLLKSMHRKRLNKM